MKIIDCEQGSPEWYAARIGIPTASQFSRLVTNTIKDGEYKLSTSLSGYAAELAAEIMAGKTMDQFDGNTPWMARGKQQEADAVALYEFTTDSAIHRVGFITMDDGLCGCSPDALVNDDGGLEVKMLKGENHVEVMSYYKKHGHAPVKYTQQVQACLWITGRKFWDQFYYHPDIDPVVVRQVPDPVQHAAFAKAVAQVIQERNAIVADLRSNRKD